MDKNSVRNMVWLSLAVVGVMALISAYAWIQLPAGAELPVHWNAAGEVDRYGGKFEALALMPLITLGLTALLAVVPRIDPRGENIMRSWPAYRATWLSLLLVMLLIHVGSVLTAFGRNVDIGVIVPVAIGVMFVILGNYMGKIRQNYMFGVRTPWTITSELSWNKTHRLGGWMFIGLGLLMIVGALAGGETWIWLMLGGIVIMLAVLMIYSYVIWRDDPNKQVDDAAG